MKKGAALLLAALLLLGTGCSRDMNWVISNEPRVRGVVEEIGEEYVLLRVLEADDPSLPEGSLVRAEKETRLSDCMFNAHVGQEVYVYYDGDIPVTPGTVPEVHGVHGYCG